jgi:hypothetical protein
MAGDEPRLGLDNPRCRVLGRPIPWAPISARREPGLLEPLSRRYKARGIPEQSTSPANQLVGGPDLAGPGLDRILGWMAGPRPTTGDLIIATTTLGLALVFLGTIPLILIEAPGWLIPAWLSEDDIRTGWVAPTRTGFDSFMAAGGVFCAAVGALVIVYGFATGLIR